MAIYAAGSTSIPSSHIRGTLSLTLEKVQEIRGKSSGGKAKYRPTGPNRAGLLVGFDDLTCHCLLHHRCDQNSGIVSECVRLSGQYLISDIKISLTNNKSTQIHLTHIHRTHDPKPAPSYPCPYLPQTQVSSFHHLYLPWLHPQRISCPYP